MAAPISSNGPYNSIQPFMAWNRLETRPRKQQFERVLRAEVHDALWMLGRQWQMGEFQGSDTGSGILAKVQMDYTMLTAVGQSGQTPQPYNLDLPLEPVIERLHYNWSEKERLLLGKKWLAFLTRRGFPVATYKPVFYDDPLFELTIDTDDPLLSNPTGVFEKAKTRSNTKLQRFLSGAILADLRTDGGKVYDLIVSGTLLSLILARGLALTPVLAMSATEQGQFNNAAADFTAWVQKMYLMPAPATPGNWNARSMDYEFDLFVPKLENSGSSLQENRLSANSYAQGHFDWYALEQDTTSYALPAAVTSNSKWQQLLMSACRFAGMPASRWWEFENGGVNFAQIDGNTTDIAKIILTQFALIYQDDWFSIPYKVPAGSYAQVKGLVVTDVFGIKTFVPNYNVESYNTANGFQESMDGWKKWAWLEISQAATINNSTAPIRKLLMPPVVATMQESNPIESVLFIRDEVSNMVWGIEKTVPDGLGKGKDGYEAARAYRAYLERFNPPVTAPLPVDPEAKIAYELASTDVPENWIPFIPVHTGSSNRSVQLQRAAMPRILDPYPISLVRPNTSILSYGISGTGVLPYLINEEEVTRAGTIVETSIQRTRWYNGNTVVWVGRRKYTGRGEGSSGLTFDNIVDVDRIEENTANLPQLPQLPVSNAQAWWMADAGITTISGQVDTWADQSGWGNHLLASLAVLRPAYSPNGGANNMPYVTFSGAQGLQVGAFDMPASQDVTVFVVFRNTSSSATGVIAELTQNTNSNSDGFYLFANDGANDQVSIGVRGNVGYGVASTSVSPNTWSYLRFEGWKSKNSQEALTYVNGGPAGALNPWGTPLANNSNNFATAAPLFVGSRANGSVFLNGQLAEIIIYAKSLTSTEIASVESYLSNKYAIPAYVPQSLIVNAVGWYKADTGIVTIGGQVDSWADQSGSGNHLTAASAMLRPPFAATGGANNQPYLTFAGAQGLQVGAFLMPVTQDVTMFLVYRNTGSSTTGTVAELRLNVNWYADGFYIATNDGANDQISTGLRGEVGYSIAAANIAANTWNYMRFEGWKSKNNQEALVYMNSGPASSLNPWGTTLSDNSNSFATAAPLFVGSRANGSVFLNGQIAEFIVYARSLTTAEITAVENYLSNKYAIPVYVPLPPVVNAVGWYKADTGIVTIGGQVDSWADQSGSGNHLTAASAMLRPPFAATGGANNQPYLTFAGAQGLQVGAFLMPVTQDVTMFLVYRNTGSSTTGTVAELRLNVNWYADGFYIATNDGANDQISTGLRGEVGYSTAAANIAANTWNHMRFENWKSRNSQEALAYINGGPASSLNPWGTTQVNNSNAFATGAPLFVGSRANGSVFLNGQIAEFIVYARSLTTGEITAVENYLKTKYSL